MIGIVQWFSFEDYETVQNAIASLKQLGVNFLRINASWADYERPGGEEWHSFLFGEFLKAQIELLPCFFYTPLNLARVENGKTPLTSNPPIELGAFSKFVEGFLGRYGSCCNWVQIWNEPNNGAYWNQNLDPEGKIFAQMAKPAVDVAHHFGKKVVLGGLSPTDYHWIQCMFDFGLMGKCEALGTHAFEGTWSRNRHPEEPEMPWKGWNGEVEGQRELFARNGHPEIQVWITETGFSTWGDAQQRKAMEPEQVKYFQELLTAPADQIFWYSLYDQAQGTTTDNVLNQGKSLDMRAFHFGLIDFEGRPKLLYNFWQTMAAKKAA